MRPFGRIQHVLRQWQRPSPHIGLRRNERTGEDSEIVFTRGVVVIMNKT
jgi:hypothetical protein